MGLYAQQTARVTEPVSEESALTLLESWTDEKGIDPICLQLFFFLFFYSFSRMESLESYHGS